MGLNEDAIAASAEQAAAEEAKRAKEREQVADAIAGLTIIPNDDPRCIPRTQLHVPIHRKLIEASILATQEWLRSLGVDPTTVTIIATPVKNLGEYSGRVQPSSAGGRRNDSPEDTYSSGRNHYSWSLHWVLESHPYRADYLGFGQHQFHGAATGIIRDYALPTPEAWQQKRLEPNLFTWDIPPIPIDATVLPSKPATLTGEAQVFIQAASDLQWHPANTLLQIGGVLRHEGSQRIPQEILDAHMSVQNAPAAPTETKWDISTQRFMEGRALPRVGLWLAENDLRPTDGIIKAEGLYLRHPTTTRGVCLLEWMAEGHRFFGLITFESEHKEVLAGQLHVEVEITADPDNPQAPTRLPVQKLNPNDPMFADELRRIKRSRQRPASPQEALQAYCMQTAVAYPREIRWEVRTMDPDHARFSWTQHNHEFVGIYHRATGALEVWVQVAAATPGTTIMEGHPYLPANDSREIIAAYEAEAQSRRSS